MRRLLLSTLAVAVVAGACGKDENNSSGTNGTTASNNGTAGTNGTNGTAGTNNTIPTAGDCEWGEYIATCGGGSEPQLTARAVGCVEYYEPSDPADVTQEALCPDEIWETTGPCSDSGLSGRRPLGCCYELAADTQLYTRHCFYDDPLAIESSAAAAEAACNDAGFCWVPAEMM